jgi:hypothetical protein
MRSFWSRVMDAPGDCSPSRNVVSKIINLSAIFHSWFEIFKKQLGHKKSPLHLAYGLLGKLNSVRYTSRPWGVSSRASKFVFIEIMYHKF